jgi:hypothetical protein
MHATYMLTLHKIKQNSCACTGLFSACIYVEYVLFCMHVLPCTKTNRTHAHALEYVFCFVLHACSRDYTFTWSDMYLYHSYDHCTCGIKASREKKSFQVLAQPLVYRYIYIYIYRYIYIYICIYMYICCIYNIYTIYSIYIYIWCI